MTQKQFFFREEAGESGVNYDKTVSWAVLQFSSYWSSQEQENGMKSNTKTWRWRAQPTRVETMDREMIQNYVAFKAPARFRWCGKGRGNPDIILDTSSIVPLLVFRFWQWIERNSLILRILLGVISSIHVLYRLLWPQREHSELRSSY